MPENPQKETKVYLNVRLTPSNLDRLKREAQRRGVSQGGFIELLMAGVIGNGKPSIDERVLDAAATACIAALDLVVIQNSDAAAMTRAVAKLEDFLELLGQRNHP